MQKIPLPDGQFLNLPDDLPQGIRDQVAAEAKSVYGIDINDVGLLERVAEFPRSVVRGAAQTLLDVPTGIAALTTGTDSGLTQGLQSIGETIRTTSPLAADPRIRGDFTTSLGEGFGSFIPFLGAGAVGQQLAKRGVGAANKYLKPTVTLPAALAIPGGIAQQADRIDIARANGEEVGPITEKLALLGGGAIGTTEILPIQRLFQRIPRNAVDYPSIRNTIVSALQTGGLEGAQEVTASILQDLTARGLYSDELPIGDSLFEEFSIGAIVGGTADVFVNSLNRRSVGMERLRDREDRTRLNQAKVLNGRKEKFEQALQQGNLEEYIKQESVNIPEFAQPEQLGVIPSLEIVSNPVGGFQLIDLNNPEKPILKEVGTEAEALVEKNKIESDFQRRRLDSMIKNAAYNLGFTDSGSFTELGATVLDPNKTELNLQTLIDFDESIDDDTRAKILEEKKNNSWFSDNVYFEMIKGREAEIPLIDKYLKSKGLDTKATVTMAEAKSILKPREFSEMLENLARHISKSNRESGFGSLPVNDKGTLKSTAFDIKQLAKSKNIDLDFNDPAVQYATERWTGFKDIRKTRNKGAKKLFMERLNSLKSFDTLTPFPNFTPRKYTPQNLNEFFQLLRQQGNEITEQDIIAIKPFGTDQQGAKQFFQDLVTSRRIVPTTGKKFAANVNFEFDVARRAEGFNETPNEFKARLEAEGKLPQEIIDNLVANEVSRQEGLIPIELSDPVVKDFAAEVEEGRLNKFSKTLQAKLKKLGLGETGVIVSNDILSTRYIAGTEGDFVFDRQKLQEEQAEAEYDKNVDIIFLSLNAINPDGQMTDAQIEQRLDSLLEHELIHALRAKDLITEKEYQFLKKEVKRIKVPESVDKAAFDQGLTYYERAKKINPNLEAYVEQEGRPRVEEQYVEEAVAELFRHRELTRQAPKRVEGIFNKIIEFFREMGAAFRESGFNKASDVFAEIEQGKVGRRDRDVIRTLRETDRERLETRLRPIIDIPETQPTTKQTKEEVKEQFKATEEEYSRQRDEEIEEDVATTPLTIDGQRITGILMSDGSRVLYPNYGDLTPEQDKQDRKTINDGFKNIRPTANLTREQNPNGSVKDSVDVLDWYIENVPSRDYAIIAERLQKSLKDTIAVSKKLQIENPARNFEKVYTIHINKTSKDRHPTLFNKKYGGKYTAGFAVPAVEYNNQVHHVIEMKPKGLNWDILLHEIAHQATQSYIERGPDRYVTNEDLDRYIRDGKLKNKLNDRDTDKDRFYKKQGRLEAELGEQLKAYREHLSTKYNSSYDKFLKSYRKGERNIPPDAKWHEYYGAINIQEYIAQGLTDRAFQENLKSIKFGKAKKSLWSQLIDSLKRIFGLDAKRGTAFSAFLETITEATNLSERDLMQLNRRMFVYDEGAQAPAQVTESVRTDTDLPSFSRKLPIKGMTKYPQTAKEIATAPLEILERTKEDYESFINELEYKDLRFPSKKTKNRLARLRKTYDDVNFRIEQILGGEGQLPLFPDPNEEDVPSFAKMKGSKTVYTGERSQYGDRVRARKYYMYDLLPDNETFFGRLYPFHKRKLVEQPSRDGSTYVTNETDEDISKRLYKGDNPMADKTIVDIQQQARDFVKKSDYIKSFGKYLRQSRKGKAKDIVNSDGTLKLELAPLKTEDFSFINAIAKNPILKKHMDWFLSQFTNKRGNLILYRALNNPQGFELKQAQHAFDDFSSTSLIREEMGSISVPTRKIPLGSNAQAILDSAEAELTPVNLDDTLGGYILDKEKREEREKLEELRKEMTDTAILPQTIYRFEVPLDRVKAYMPYVKSLIVKGDGMYKPIQNILFDNALEAGGGYFSGIERPRRDEYETEDEFEDALYEHENEVERQKEYEIDEEFGAIAEAIEEEVEVIADLKGLKPQLAYTPEQKILDEIIPAKIKIFERGGRNTFPESQSEQKRINENVAKVEEEVKGMPNGEKPTVNPNASDIAIDAFEEFNNDPNPKTPDDDIPNFSRPTTPDYISDVADQVDPGYVPPIKSFGARLIDLVKDPIDSFGDPEGVISTTKKGIADYFKNFRTQIIDKYDAIDKKLVQAGVENEELRRVLNTAATSAIAAIRMADRARGYFQHMLQNGYITDQYEDGVGLPFGEDLEIDTVHNPFIEGDTSVGGLTKFMMPLFADPTVDGERIFKTYASLRRTKTLTENGREIESPFVENGRLTPRALEAISEIETNNPEVVEAFNNYQKWNNKLLDFAQAKGLLDSEMADMWRTHSSYYPFYRQMIDGAVEGPRIAAGVLPNNPLSIKLEGSEKQLDIGVIEAISRNSLSLLTASLKNDGVSKLVRSMEESGDAEVIPKQKARGKNVIKFFEDGVDKYAALEDVELYNAINGIGGVSTDFLTQMLGFPARILRDAVTRDPGFMAVNLLRDTLSAAVTSGAPLSVNGEGFTPVISTFKNMFRDQDILERSGVLGGYDFANDEGSIKQLVTRSMRQNGLNSDNSMNLENLFIKAWDGLGAYTTKSDGATRLAVYEAVYKKLKDKGETEAVARSEAAYQALEIINFGRRGLSPAFRIVTSAIPFLNARIQGLDVLWRSASGKYSATQNFEGLDGRSLDEVKRDIQLAFLKRGGALTALTAMYYLLVSDTDEYKNVRREVRDDNWLIPLGNGLPAIKIPIPFEVGMMFKAIPERVLDVFVGEDALSNKAIGEAKDSILRQLGTSANIPFFEAGFGIQAIKPIAEVYLNRNSFTNTEIVPYYQLQLEPGLQARPGTNQLFKNVGETFNLSPIKIEHVFKGYTGTLGGYVLDVIDAVTRGVTGEPYLPPDINTVPVLSRFLINADRGGGLQQQFYELRDEVRRVVQSTNKLRKAGRLDELASYRATNLDVLNVKGTVNALNRYLENWRMRRDNLLQRDDISAFAKRDLLDQLIAERDQRLSVVPELRKKANIPIVQNI